MIKTLATRLSIIVSLIALMLPVLASVPLRAQEQQEKEGIGISPTKLELEADPGETVEGSFLVTNPGTNETKYTVNVKDFSVVNEEYEKDFSPIEGASSPVEWFSVPEGVRTVKPGDREELSYKVSVPEDAIPKGYYAVIFVETAAEEADETGVARIKRVGSLVYLTVKGGSVEKGSIESFEAKTLQSTRPVKAEVRVRNDGNVHFTSEGELRLRDIFGREVSKTSMSGTIIPATIRKFSPELKLSQPFGIYRLEGEMRFFGQTHQLDSKWVIVGSPFWIVLWTVIVIGWAVVMIRWVVKRVKRKKTK